MDIGYTWIYGQGKICCHFRLLMWTSFIGPFVHPVGEEGIWIVAESINIQDPSYEKSICKG